MKNLHSLLILLILITFNQTNAQLKEVFEKGTITKKDGTKIDGFIRNDDLNYKLYKTCFKTSITDKKCTVYDTSQIKSFQTEKGEIFDLMTLIVDNKTTEISLFAKKIIEGKTSLYKSVYNSNVFYIISKNGTKYVLQNDLFISGQTEVKRYNYMGILNLATENFPIKTNNTKIEYNEKNFKDIVTQYNTSLGFESKTIKLKEKATKFFIASIGGGSIDNGGSEYFIQLTNRIYYPNFNKNTSLNIGLNYYDLNFIDRVDGDVNQSLISIPFQLQYNILNKNIRPFLFSGMNFSYTRRLDSKGNSLIEDKGLQQDFGFSFLLGAGIEIDIYKGFMLKSEYRYETFNHGILFGIAYNFSK
jgi:hypothetical protein